MSRLFRWHYIRWVALIAANLLFFGFVDPQSNASLLLFGGFLLVAIDSYLILSLALTALARLLNRQDIARRRVAGALTGVIIILLALQSIGQLSVRDVIAVLIIAAIFLFYSSYYRFGHRS